MTKPNSFVPTFNITIFFFQTPTYRITFGLEKFALLTKLSKLYQSRQVIL